MTHDDDDDDSAPPEKYRHYRHWDQRAAVIGMAEMVPVWERPA